MLYVVNLSKKQFEKLPADRLQQSSGYFDSFFTCKNRSDFENLNIVLNKLCTQ